MKFDKNVFIELVRNFTINFSVVSFGLGIFEENNYGYIVGCICLISAIITCFYKQRSN